jgi:hypothetical protein
LVGSERNFRTFLHFLGNVRATYFAQRANDFGKI